MDDSSSPTNSANTTVTFDVGGSIYRVSRSLLEQHPNTMLARLASKTWHQAASPDPLFIDRNGERFQYCLDYMRDGGNVVLPATIPKESFLQDLVYFGFQDVDPSTILVAKWSPSMFEKCLGAFKSVDVELEQNIDLLKFVRHCLLSYKENGSTRIYFTDTSKDLKNVAYWLPMDATKVKLFNDYLGKVGLKYLKYDYGTESVNLGHA